MTNIELAKEVNNLRNTLNQVLSILAHYSDMSNPNFKTEITNLIAQEKKETNE